jgi:hypothetical protein
MEELATSRWAMVRRFLAEFFIVALGVLAALAADNWNDSRKERDIERAFLAGIATDMEQNVESLDRAIGQADINRKALQRVMRGIESGQSQWQTPDDFVRDLILCTYLGIPQLSSIAFDELRSTGSLRLIRDDAFKRRLSEYYANFGYHGQFHEEYRRKEAAVEEALLGFLPLRERLVFSDDDEAALGTSVNVEEHLKRMRERPQLLDRLGDMVWVQHRIATRYLGTRAESEAFLGELGR